MNNSAITSALYELLVQGNRKLLAEFCNDLHPADVAESLEEFEPKQAAFILSSLDVAFIAEVLSHLEPSVQADVAEQLGDPLLAEVISLMSPDERVDLLQVLPEDRSEALMRMLARSEREDIIRLSSYEDGTAGAIMTSDYARLVPGMTTRQALDKLRMEAPSRETIYYAYVIDADRKLIGCISLKDLILADPDARIGDLMFTNLVTAAVDEDQEEVAKKMAKYDLIAIPVIDNKGALAGIVTFDDAADVTEEETTYDFHKMAPITSMEEEGVGAAGILTMARKRAPWLLILIFVNILAGIGIAYYEATIESVVALVFFLPLLIASGGNAGSQSTILMIRALATEEVVISDWFRLLGRELVVAVALGGAMGVAVSMVGFFRAGPDVAVVVATSMAICVLIGSIVGMSLPFLLTRMKIDPATASAPLVTSIADILGVLVYFGFATWYLGIGS